MRRSAALGLVSALGCTPSSSPATAAAEPEPPPVEVEAKPEPAPASSEALVIGIVRPPRFSAAARKANRTGLRLHRKGEYAGSRGMFAQAVAAEPEHDMARFNLACALSRLGRDAEAAAEVITLLSRDPVRFYARAHEDADLESLRASPHWEAVLEHWQRVDAALDRAFEHGVPSMFYRYSTPEAHWTSPQQGGTKNLVAGLYLHGQQRFVPLARGGTAIRVDAGRRRIVKIDSEVWEGVVHTTWRSSKISVLSVDPQEPMAISTDLDTDGPRAVGRPDIIEGWEADNSGFEMSMALVPNDAGVWIDLLWHTHLGQPYEKRSSLQLSAEGLALTPNPMPDGEPRISLTYQGVVFIDPAPAGHRLGGRSYQPPGRETPIELSKRHQRAAWQSLVPSSDGRFVVVTSIEHRKGPRYEEGEPGILRHVVDLVDLDSGSVRTLVSAKGVAYATIGPDEAVYVDSGDHVSRWETPEAQTPEAVVEGLRLAPALEPYVCDLCG